jgi:alkanesulfonate monooxygenase SsuD/methylene tetrahydromethanopterin reductase-like flavin-dependent oxidoreductase (luciferase family)
VDTGIGLPNAVPDTPAPVITEWARRAEQGGFSTLGTIGRLVYPSYELIVGGQGEAGFRRAARIGDGWIMGGGTPDMFAQASAAVDQAWQEAGREGRPRKLSLAYFALGPDARQAADTYLKRYYAFTGPMADQIAAGAAVSPDQVRGAAAAFEQAGCDELIFVPCSAETNQVGLLAEVLHG